MVTCPQDGIPGYPAHLDWKEAGPGLLIVHHHYGVMGNIKVMVCDIAKIGYTTIVPDLYKVLGESDGVHEAQKKTTDGKFNEILSSAWRYLTARTEDDEKRCGVVGFCMGGRIGIHFVASNPSVRAFGGYYPSVRDEEPSKLRPRHPNDAVKDIKCQSQIFFGGQDHVTSVGVQQKLMANFQASGQPIDWHLFQHGGQGFALADGDWYDPSLANQTWTLMSDFLERELGNQ